MDCVDLSFLVVMLYNSFARCSHWGRLNAQNTGIVRCLLQTAASRLSTTEQVRETVNKGFTHTWPWESTKWGKNGNDVTEWTPPDSVSEM